jgi:hypothetical protein
MMLLTHFFDRIRVLWQMAQGNFQHVMRIKGWDYAVVGQQNPFLGRGGGQFANHSRSGANCIIIVKSVTTNEWALDSNLPMIGTHFPILVLVATRYIKKGEEILWTYPRNTLVRCGIWERGEVPKSLGTGQSLAAPQGR